jgi:AraC-like DNA-binding protein
MKRPDRHNEIELNLLKEGDLQYLLGGEKVIIQAGRLAIFWAAIPHQIIGPKSHAGYFVATIPLAWFLQCQFPESFVQPILHGRVLLASDSNKARGDYELFNQWVADIKDQDPAKRKLVLLEMEARLLRFALKSTPQTSVKRTSHPGHPTAGGFERAEEMASFIARNYTRKITAKDISGAVRLHPNYAVNLFKETFGLSFVDYVTQHRISQAQRLLATSNRKIVEVALDSGFNSISRFNEAFRRACGCSPREYRRSHRI